MVGNRSLHSQRLRSAACQYIAGKFFQREKKLKVVSSTREAMGRLGRHLVKYPRLLYKYPFQKEVDGLDACVDSDHARCSRTKKSTSGGCVVVCKHRLKSWSSTPPTTILSSGEAELRLVVKGGACIIGFPSMLVNFIIMLFPMLWTDSSAFKGMCSRDACR